MPLGVNKFGHVVMTMALYRVVLYYESVKSGLKYVMIKQRLHGLDMPIYWCENRMMNDLFCVCFHTL